MVPRCYVSHKSADIRYRNEIAGMGVHTAANIFDSAADYDDESIVAKLRQGPLADTAVTIYLIGKLSAENVGKQKQIFIKRELQASKLPSHDGLPNFILGIVLPTAYDRIYNDGVLNINDMTVIREFSSSYFTQRCCQLIRWDDFKTNPNKYIMEAYAERFDISG